MDLFNTVRLKLTAYLYNLLAYFLQMCILMNFICLPAFCGGVIFCLAAVCTSASYLFACFFLRMC